MCSCCVCGEPVFVGVFFVVLFVLFGVMAHVSGERRVELFEHVFLCLDEL